MVRPARRGFTNPAVRKIRSWWLTADCPSCNFSAISFTEISPDMRISIMRIRVVSPKNLKNSDSSKRVSRERFLSIYEQSFIFSYIEISGETVKGYARFVTTITIWIAGMDNLSKQKLKKQRFSAKNKGIFVQND